MHVLHVHTNLRNSRDNAARFKINSVRNRQRRENPPPAPIEDEVIHAARRAAPPYRVDRGTHSVAARRTRGGDRAADVQLGLSTSLLIEARRDAYDHAVENARNLMLLIERDIARNIELTICRCRTSSTALPILNWRPCPAPASPAAVRPRGDRRVSRVDLRDGRARQYRDRFERIARPARQFRRPRLFRRASRPARQGLYISRPYASRLRGGALTIALSRRINRPDGAFAGIVVGTLSIDYFRALLDGLAVGKHGSAAIVEDNGTPRVAPAIRPARGRPRPAQLAAVHRIAARPRRRADRSRRDRRHPAHLRLKHLAALPLIVDVAPAEIDIYASWHHRAIWTVVLMCLFTGFIAWGRWRCRAN